MGVMHLGVKWSQEENLHAEYEDKNIKKHKKSIQLMDITWSG